jgi:single-stranded-DNA-specific exonuclease
MKVEYLIKKREAKNIKHFIAAGIDPFIAHLLYGRGIRTEKEAELFLHGDYNDLHDPALIRNIDKAFDIISKAIDTGKKIYIFGDYDVDGVTSAAIMYLTIRELGGDVHVRLPDRITEGYGMSTVAVEELHKKGCNLIITVDNGIRCHDEIALAKSLGIQVVVLDHHLPGDTLPDAEVVIDLYVDGETYPYKDLVGCGLAFKMSCYLYDQYGFEGEGLKNIDLATIGTVADVGLLTGENRIIVKEGLKYMNDPDYNRPGVIELMGSFGAELGTLSSADIGFKIGPALNAPGRLLEKGADNALELLLCEDSDLAVDYVSDLFQVNETRKSLTNEALEKAEEYIKQEGLQDDKVMVLYIKDVPHGIVGLVSGKITEKYYRPSIVFTDVGNGTLKASGRSIPAYNLYEGLCTCDDLFVKYGGHKQAAGMTIKNDLQILVELRRRLNEHADIVLTDEDLVRVFEIDDVITEDDITEELMKDLELIEPSGHGNPKPIFLVRGFRPRKKLTSLGWQPFTFMGDEKTHLKLFGNSCDAVGFGMADLFKKLEYPRSLDVVFTLGINHFMGNITIQMELKDIRKAEESKKEENELMNAISDAFANLTAFQAQT